MKSSMLLSEVSLNQLICTNTHAPQHQHTCANYKMEIGLLHLPFSLHFTEANINFQFFLWF